YVMSCGGSPMDTKGYIRLPAPIVVLPSSTTWGPTTVPEPIATSGPIMLYASIVTSSAISAFGDTIAVGCIGIFSPLTIEKPLDSRFRGNDGSWLVRVKVKLTMY